MRLEQELALKFLERYRSTDKVDIFVPPWAEPLRKPARFKAAYGGRTGGKSHYFAEALVERMVLDKNLRVVCIREIQRSLKFSAKRTIEDKIQSLGVSHLFECLHTEIRRRGGKGILTFEGMQDHTADSIKSLEDVRLALLEEAQSLSQRSIDLLLPTIIRKDDAEIWALWNPENQHDAIDVMFRGPDGPPPNSIVVPVSYLDNPLIAQASIELAERDRANDIDKYNWVWLGHYNVKSKAQIFSGRWKIDEFEADPQTWDGPYHGGDWGFASDPTAAIRCWIHDRCLWIDYESYEYQLELDDIADRWKCDIPGAATMTTRADSAQPAMISHVRAKGIHGLIAADKWQGSVEAGIKYLQNFQKIIIHPRCKNAQDEFRLYSYKVNGAGDPTNVIIDANNHCLSPDTMIETINGAVRISQIKAGDLVLTRKGYRRVLKAWISGRNAKTYNLSTASGLSLTATGNHEIFTGRGFVRTDALRYNDDLTILNHQLCHQKKGLMRGLFGQGIPTQKGAVIAFISDLRRSRCRGGSAICTGGFGAIVTGLSLKGSTFTMSMRTPLIIGLKTLNAFQDPSICQSTQRLITKKTKRLCLPALTVFEHLRVRGTVVQRRDENCTGSLPRIFPPRIGTNATVGAITATKTTKLTTLKGIVQGFAPMPVSQRSEEKTESTIFQKLALIVSKILPSLNTQNVNSAPDRVRAVVENGILPEVWDLTVEDEHEFFANGILVHNCIDSLRYSLSPLIKDSEPGYFGVTDSTWGY